MGSPREPEKRRLWLKRKSEIQMGEKNSFYGKHHTEETKQRIGEAETGEKNSMYGKHHSQKTKEKIGNALSKYSGTKNGFYGRHHTEETKQRLGELASRRTGELAGHWQGGITPLNLAIRGTVTYELWRKAVFHKDRFQCQDCGKMSDGDLNAHHLYALSRLIEDYNIVSLGQAIRTEELWDINNGITLCEDCHIKRHEN